MGRLVVRLREGIASDPGYQTLMRGRYEGDVTPASDDPSTSLRLALEGMLKYASYYPRGCLSRNSSMAGSSTRSVGEFRDHLTKTCTRFASRDVVGGNRFISLSADNEVEENPGKHSSDDRSSGQRLNSISSITASRPIALPATRQHAPKAETQKGRRSVEER